MLKWAGIGCGGLLGLVVILAVLGAIIGGGGQTADTGAAESEQQEAGSGEGGAQPTASIGETLTVGDAEWVVNDARMTDQLKSQFGEFGNDKQGTFVVVDFTFTNNTGEAVTLDPVMMTLIDGQDRNFEADTDTFDYIPPEKDLFLEQVNPGVSREGQVIYTIAPDASDLRLEVGGAGFFSSERGYINLGL